MESTQAIGVIETCGMPAAIVTADILGKGADVRVVGLENTDAGRISVIIRGRTGAVQAAISNAVKSLTHHPGATVLGHHIIPCPDASSDFTGLLSGQNRSSFSGDSVEWLDD
jgi:microcompartment protein CcmL/EutN